MCDVIIVMKDLSRHAACSSGELQTAMSALENAISMLGSVTSSTRTRAEAELEWPADVVYDGNEMTMVGGARWTSRASKDSGMAVTDLSNTLSLLDNTINAIDRAMSPRSFRQRVADTDFRRFDVTSGLRPWRLDFGGGSSAWRGQAYSGRTELGTSQRTESVELDVRQPGIIVIAPSLSVCLSVCLSVTSRTPVISNSGSVALTAMSSLDISDISPHVQNDIQNDV